MADEHYTQEVWRVVWEAPSYMISNFGRVMRVRAKREGCIGNFAKPWLSDDGYWMVSLLEDGEKSAKAFQLHRLICKAFVGPPPSMMHQAAHNNGVRTDNRPENLRWATALENTADRVLHGTDAIGRRNPNAKLTEDDVHAIRRATTGYGLAARLARKYGVANQTIEAIRAGKTWKHLPWEDGVEPDRPHDRDKLA